MLKSRPSMSAVLMMAAMCSGAQQHAASGTASVRNVRVLDTKGTVEIEIESSERVVPQALVLTGPDRLVLDFPNATPSKALRSHSVDRGDVKNVRVGLFSSNPPTTRVVVDLQGPVAYQLFPEGKTIILKVGDGTAARNAPSAPGLVNASYEVGSASVSLPVAKAALVPLDVSFRNGLLSIRANRVSLSEVLFAVQQRTGAEIAIPAGAEQEKVAVNDGPAPAAEVLAHLLNGSRFNFLILNSATDPRKLDKVVLSLRPEGSYTPSAAPASDDDDVAVTRSSIPPPVQIAHGNGDAPAPSTQGDDDTPASANVMPPKSTFPNARPTEVKTPDQDAETPDY